MVMLYMITPAVTQFFLLCCAIIANIHPNIAEKLCDNKDCFGIFDVITLCYRIFIPLKVR